MAGVPHHNAVIKILGLPRSLELLSTTLANKKIDDNEVDAIREEIYRDGQLDLDDVRRLIEIRPCSRHRVWSRPIILLHSGCRATAIDDRRIGFDGHQAIVETKFERQVTELAKCRKGIRAHDRDEITGSGIKLAQQSANGVLRGRGAVKQDAAGRFRKCEQAAVFFTDNHEVVCVQTLLIVELVVPMPEV